MPLPQKFTFLILFIASAFLSGCYTQFATRDYEDDDYEYYSSNDAEYHDVDNEYSESDSLIYEDGEKVRLYLDDDEDVYVSY
jgi:hypothetical protein